MNYIIFKFIFGIIYFIVKFNIHEIKISLSVSVLKYEYFAVLLCFCSGISCPLRALTLLSASVFSLLASVCREQHFSSLGSRPGHPSEKEPCTCDCQRG